MKKSNNWSKNKNKEYARITIYFMVFSIMFYEGRLFLSIWTNLLIFLFLFHKSDPYNELCLNISNYDIVLSIRICSCMFASQLWCFELSIIFRLLLMIILILWLQYLLIIIVFYVMKAIASIHSDNKSDKLVVFRLLF